MANNMRAVQKCIEVFANVYPESDVLSKSSFFLDKKVPISKLFLSTPFSLKS